MGGQKIMIGPYWAALISLLVGMCFAAWQFFVSGIDRIQKKLTMGIAPEQINKSGETIFTANIEIRYKDGNLEKIILSPGTTVKKSSFN